MRMLLKLALGVVLCAACSKNDQPPPPSSGSPMAQPESGPKGKRAAGTGPSEKAQQMFATVCAMCHGADGTGNGPAAETLTTKPRNYTDATWQQSVTDDDLRKIITLGGQAVGKSPLMPGNPQLKDAPETLDGLVQIIRGFGRK
jgi:cytochrome c551/c552